MQEAVKRAIGPQPSHAVLPADPVIDDVSALAAVIQQLSPEGVTLWRQRRQRAILRKVGGAGVVALGHGRGGRLDTFGMDQPADAPAGHRPWLGETVDGK